MINSNVSRLWFQGHGFKQVPPELIDNKILWAHPDGYFVNQYGKRLLHTFAPSLRTPGRHCHNGKRGNDYPSMRHFGCKHCHILICTTFHGPRPAGYECDHLNGNVLDYSADNLEWVTRKENHRRAKLLRVLRSIGRDPKLMSREELLEIFNNYEFTNPQNID